VKRGEYVTGGRAEVQPGGTISYRIPTITLGGSNLVYCAAVERHVGLYPISTADEARARAI
jgi:uncharacterized protein YdhG (YjbR/CyaY superfamily)